MRDGVSLSALALRPASSAAVEAVAGCGETQRRFGVVRVQLLGLFAGLPQLF
jgi:hypothetical protein